MNHPTELNAYRKPQAVKPGCMHQLGCRCTPPFWLRPASPAEDAIADRIYGRAVTETGARLDEK